MNIYEFSDYKLCLKNLLQEKKKLVSPRFTYEKMSQACNIQKTYLSRALNHDTSHLSEEQLYFAANFLGLTKEEEEFLQLLRAYQRAVNPKYQETLGKKVEDIQQAHRKSESKLKDIKDINKEADFSRYHLDPNILLVHIFLCSEKYRNSLKLISQKLQLTEEYFSEILTTLEQLKVIKLEESGYRILMDSIHLSVDSPLYHHGRIVSRVKSLERIQKVSKKHSYNFSAVFTSEPAAVEKIRAKFLEFLEYAEPLVNESKDEEVFQMNFDLFDWSL